MRPAPQKTSSRAGSLRSLAALAVLLPALAWASPARAGRMDIAWDPVPDPDVVGYRVYVGTTPGAADLAVVEVGRVSEITLTGLPDCTDLFIGVKALDAGGLESVSFGGFVGGMSQPYVSGSTPDQLMQGDQNITLVVDGANFTDGMQRTDMLFDDPDVRVLSLQVVSCTRLEVEVSVGPFPSAPNDPGYSGAGDAIEEVPAAEIGGRTVSVTAPDSSGAPIIGLSQDALTVLYDIARSDLDGTGRVDAYDLVRIARAYGSSELDNPTQPGYRYDEDADLDGSGSIDGTDLVLLAEFFGQLF